MDNPFKNNPLASGLMGFIIGAGVLWCGNSIISRPQQHEPTMSGFMSSDNDNRTFHHDTPPYHGLEEDPDGDVVITKSGSKYHSPYGCSSLSKSKNFRTVNREDAENVGIGPCSKCNP